MNIQSPRILEDAPREVVVIRKPRRTLCGLAKNDNATPVDHAVAAVTLGRGAGVDQLAHAPTGDGHMVFQLVRSGDVKGAAKLAARLINLGREQEVFDAAGLRQVPAAERSVATMVAASSAGMNAKLVDISPAMAIAILKKNAGNRRIDPKNLSDIMNDLIGGRWKVNGETVILSSNGESNDGQHRCFACLLSGVALRTLLAVGAERDSMDTVDIGKKRTAADRLGLRGEPDYVVASALAALMLELDFGKKGTQTQNDEYFAANKKEIRAAIRVKGTNILRVGPSSAGAAAIKLMRLGAHEEDISEFLATVRKNEGTASGNAARALHMALYPKNSDKQKPLKLGRVDMVSTLCHHFKAWLRNQKVHEAIMYLPMPESL